MDKLEIYEKIAEYGPANSLKYDLLKLLQGGRSNLKKNLFDSLNQSIKGLDPALLIELIGIFHQKDKEKIEFAKTNERKHFGIFYTDYNLAKFIVKETLRFKKQIDYLKITFLEPCSGTGNFVIAYLDVVLDGIKKPSKSIVQKIVNNIYCADIDKEAIDILKKILAAYLKIKYHLVIKIPEKNYFAGNLLFKISQKNIIRNDPKDIFEVRRGFDVIVTNPPYKLLKENSNKYGETKNKKITKNLIAHLRNEKVYSLNEGMLNYYKLFTEEIVKNYSNKAGLIGLLIPRTILNDRQSEKLRNYIFQSYKTSVIFTIPEKNNFFPDVSQAFCFFSIDKSQKGNSISMVDSVRNECDFKRKPINISIKKLKRISSSIIVGKKISLNILEKLHKNPKLATLTSIINLRGELDLTFHKNYITQKPTKLTLLKGAHIQEFFPKKSDEYVSESFIKAINSKNFYITNQRLVCQQISNIHSKKRLKFALVGPNNVLGNSCNFLAMQMNGNLFNRSEHISLKYLSGLLNSYLLDWRFRLSNSNNHIANYELNELPIALSGDQLLIDSIEKISSSLIKNYDEDLFNKLNVLIFKLYGLDKEEALYITSNYPHTKLTQLIHTQY